MSSSSAPPPPGKRRRLGEILRAAGVIDELQLNSALAEQKKWGGKLGEILIRMSFLDEDTMIHALSRQLSIPVVDLDRMELSAEHAKLLRLELAQRYGVFPIGVDPKYKVLHVATADPTNIDALHELSFATGSTRVQLSVAGQGAIERAIRRFYLGETLSVATAPPAELPQREETFEVTTANDASARPTPRTAAPTTIASGDPAALMARVAQLTQQVEMLQKRVSTESHARRALLELLFEKKLLRADDYQARLRSNEGGRKRNE
ncbi:MAG: hypothetical protein ACT4TC_09235 [Myxococcaceae bacterium]